MRYAACALVGSTALFVVGCSSEPSRVLEPTGERPSFALGEVSGTLTPANSSQSEFASLGSFTYNTLVTVSVSGLETITFANLAGWGALAGTTLAQVDAGGVFDGWSSSGDCSANVRWGFSQGGGRNICWYDNPNRPPPQTYSDTAIAKGTGTALWQAGPRSFQTFCGGAGQPACFDVSGSFFVVVIPFAASLEVASSGSVGLPNTSVLFTASVTPSQAGSFAVPFQVLRWEWIPDLGSPSGAICGTAVQCWYTPATSGTMTVQGVANGEVQETTRRVRVNFCPPSNDSTGKLDDPDFRRILLDELAQGRSPSGGPFSERMGYLFRMPNGGYEFAPAGINPDDCNVDRGSPTVPSGGTYDDLIHVHPVGYRERWFTCRRVAPGTEKTGDYPPSSGDLGALTELLQYNPDARFWLITGFNNVFQVDASGIVRRWVMTAGCAARTQ